MSENSWFRLLFPVAYPSGWVAVSQWPIFRYSVCGNWIKGEKNSEQCRKMNNIFKITMLLIITVKYTHINIYCLFTTDAKSRHARNWHSQNSEQCGKLNNYIFKMRTLLIIIVQYTHKHLPFKKKTCKELIYHRNNMLWSHSHWQKQQNILSFPYDYKRNKNEDTNERWSEDKNLLGSPPRHKMSPSVSSSRFPVSCKGPCCDWHLRQCRCSPGETNI